MTAYDRFRRRCFSSYRSERRLARTRRWLAGALFVALVVLGSWLNASMRCSEPMWK